MSMERYRNAIEEALAGLAALRQESDAPVTEADASPREGEIPQPLRSAMRYSLLLPGKRLRPVLLLAAYHLVADDWQSALPFACAVEMIHAYSLIHDDLPALDNDALRRGQPTNHRVFGEDMAILAGDGLLNLAYETMLSAPISRERPERALSAMREIARRCGVTGMIAGQTLDVKLENHAPSLESVRYIHMHKTADLITAPIVAGLTLAGANEQQLDAGRAYGQNVGVAFQIVDDLLDEQGDASEMGKQTGMDALRGKQTWPAVRGLDAARADARKLIDGAVLSLAPFGDRADFLVDLARKTLVRRA